jgi:hypothetical protein
MTTMTGSSRFTRFAPRRERSIASYILPIGRSCTSGSSNVSVRNLRSLVGISALCRFFNKLWMRNSATA